MPKPTGTVYLCENAIIDNSYSNTIDFKNPSEQLTYWGSLVKDSISDFMYIRRTQQYIKVNKNLNDLDSINYLYFRSDENRKLYYCFVTSKEYISENTSYIYFEVDVIQSYMFDYELKQSYVLQEHCDRWTADHKPIYSRTAEGLDYGSEYTLESAFNVVGGASYRNTWYLAVLTPGFTINSGRNSGEPTYVDKVSNPYIFVLIPSQAGFKAKVSNPSGLGDPETIDLNTIELFNKLMSDGGLSKFVKQIVRLPYIPFDWTIDDSWTIDTTADPSTFTYSVISASEGSTLNGNFIVIDTYTRWKLISQGRKANKEYFKRLASLDLFEGLELSLPTAEQWAEVKQNPYSVERDRRFESKLLTYPYRYNILTDWKNQPLIIKNEYVGGDKISVNFTQGIGFNAPARYWVDNYRKDVEGRSQSIVQLAQEDVPITEDMYYTYMLQNRNQLQAERSNAKATMQTNMDLALTNGLVSGIMSGSAKGVAGGLVGSLQGVYNAYTQGMTNYNNLIRSQNAVASDIKNLPDTITCSNDTSFNIQDDNRYLSLYRMKICCEFEELLADTFATSGYTVKRVKLPNLRSRLRYNYIKTIGANVVGSFNQDDLAKIRAIFDNGITFWHYNTVNFKPYDYSLENIETSLL